MSGQTLCAITCQETAAVKYRGEDADLIGSWRHTRNKSLAIVGKGHGLTAKAATVFSTIGVRLALRAMRKSGFQVIVSEQMVENGLVLRALRNSEKRILDFGGFESTLPLQLSALGFSVTVLDQRRYPFSHPNLRVVVSDLFSPTLSCGEPYDAIISISTVEHLGLGRYGDIAKPDADERGARILWSMLREGGRLFATVPLGEPTTQRGYRVYDTAGVHRVFPQVTAIRCFAKEGREGTWCEVPAESVQHLAYSEPRGVMPVEAVAFIICEKRGDTA